MDLSLLLERFVYESRLAGIEVEYFLSRQSIPLFSDEGKLLYVLKQFVKSIRKFSLFKTAEVENLPF